jgi:hypothetical protein
MDYRVAHLAPLYINENMRMSELRNNDADIVDTAYQRFELAIRTSTVDCLRNGIFGNCHSIPDYIKAKLGYGLNVPFFKDDFELTDLTFVNTKSIVYSEDMLSRLIQYTPTSASFEDNAHQQMNRLLTVLNFPPNLFEQYRFGSLVAMKQFILLKEQLASQNLRLNAD